MSARKRNEAVTPPEMEQAAPVSAAETVTPPEAEVSTGAAVTPPQAEATENTTTDAPQAVKRFAQVAAEQGLNLRAGPGREFPVVTVLDAEESVELLPLPQGLTVPGWVPVSIFGTTGWLRTEFLRMQEE